MRESPTREKDGSILCKPLEHPLPQSRFERFFIIKDLLDDATEKLEKARELFSQTMDYLVAQEQEYSVGENKIINSALSEFDAMQGEDPAELRKTYILREREEQISGQKIIEGIFDGQNMIGLDGKQYHVPVNYASKSKLAEGDTLKLTISGQGNFLYKQIGPVERVRIVATLDYNSDLREYTAKAQDKVWKVLTASITYFKGVAGDEIVLIVPKGRMSTWAAVENIIKKDLI